VGVDYIEKGHLHLIASLLPGVPPALSDALSECRKSLCQ